MKWKIRPGFSLFNSPDEAIEHHIGNRAIKPRATEGRTVVLSAQQLREISQHKMLGALIPCDAEADAYFGDTVPLVAKCRSGENSPVRPAWVDDLRTRTGAA